jgi:hypothetical protein
MDVILSGVRRLLLFPFVPHLGTNGRRAQSKNLSSSERIADCEAEERLAARTTGLVI